MNRGITAGRLLVLGVALGLSGYAYAAPTNTTVTLYPNDVPDESTPRTVADAPNTQFGPDSWQNTASANPAKVNAYVTPTELFSHDITINDIASITYFTKTSSGEVNWFLNIYTNPVTGSNPSWYGDKFTNGDYGSYAADGTWHNNTVSVLTATDSAGGVTGPNQTLSQWQVSYGSDVIEYFSPQTSSTNNDADSQIDGLVITLKDGSVGNVDFAAVPTPTAAYGGLGLLGLLGLSAAKRRRTC